MLGDSNFFYYPSSFMSKYLGRFWVQKSVADIVHEALPGRVILVSSTYLQVRASCMQYLATTLETILTLNPNVEVHVLVLLGQNDADSASRSCTRNSHEIRAHFCDFIESRIQSMNKAMAAFPQVTTHWVKPFDDPDAEFTPLYVNLVEDLKECVEKQDQVLNFGPFVSFEADHYHLTTSEREKFAAQILDWCAGAESFVLRSVSWFFADFQSL